MKDILIICTKSNSGMKNKYFIIWQISIVLSDTTQLCHENKWYKAMPGDQAEILSNLCIYIL